MGRSVSTPCDASSTVYVQIDEDVQDELDFQDFILDPFIFTLERVFPSFYRENTWLGREDHALLANAHARAGISEYCGLVACWLLPRDDNDFPELSAHWCAKADAKFRAAMAECFGPRLYYRVATASNGEAFYRPMNPNPG